MNLKISGFDIIVYYLRNQTENVIVSLSDAFMFTV